MRCARGAWGSFTVQGTESARILVRSVPWERSGCSSRIELRYRPSPLVTAAAVRIDSDSPTLSSSTSTPSSLEPGQPQPKPNPSSTEGYIELFLCSLLWGTYNPSLRYIYQSDTLEIDPQSLTAIRTLMAAVALGIAVALGKGSKSKDSTGISNNTNSSSSNSSSRSSSSSSVVSSSSGSSSSSSNSSSSSSSSRAAGDMQAALNSEEEAAAELLTAFVTSKVAVRGGQSPPSTTGNPSISDATTSTSEPAIRNILRWTSTSVILAGIELGMYNFFGTSCQALGLQLTTATRAGFLVQLTAVFVPILSYLAGERISLQVRLAVVMGVLGSCLVTYDGMMSGASAAAADAADAAGPSGGGEVLLLTACLFYSMSVVRLGMYAPKFNSVDLAAVKKFTLCTTSFIWWASTRPEGFFAAGVDVNPVDAVSSVSGDMSSAFIVWAVVLYSSLGPGALATVLQTKGQTLVPATQAQVIFSLTPLWGAGIAYFAVGQGGGEAMGPLSWTGGLVILAASLLASQSQQKEIEDAKSRAA